MAGFVLPIVSGLAGLAGGLFPKKEKSTQTTNTSQQTNQEGNTNFNQFTNANATGQQAGTTSNTHNLSPFQQQLAERFTRDALKRADSGADISGYQHAGLQAINDTSSANNVAMKNLLASRGLSFSPVAANAEIQQQQGRIGQQSQFLQSLPLLQRAMQQEDQKGLLDAFGMLPTDTTGTSTQDSSGISSGTSGGTGYSQNRSGTEGTSNTEGTGQINGNPIAGGLGGLGAGMAQQGSGPGSMIDMISKLFGGG